MKLLAHAYAKLNLSLDVVRKMDDGYHAMRMVMQSVALCDDIAVSCEKGSGIDITTNFKYLPRDEKNIAAKAVRIFFEHTGIQGYRVALDMTKRIPVCAGLGGGSADAAAVLRGLNTLFRTGMNQAELELLGGRLGSDVPFCIAGGTVLAEGRGEILTELKSLPNCHAVICKPSFHISTPHLFSKLDWEKIRCRPDTEGIIESLECGDLCGVARRIYNVFESVLPTGTNAIGGIKDMMLDHGALGAVMTGTGSAVFGLYGNQADAETAYNDLSRYYKDCFLTRTTGKLTI